MDIDTCALHGPARAVKFQRTTGPGRAGQSSYRAVPGRAGPHTARTEIENSSSSSSSNVSSERRSKRPRCSAHSTSYRVKQTILI